MNGIPIRIIPTVLIDGWRVIKTIQFRTIRNVGSPTQTFKLYNYRRVDELVVLDIRASKDGRAPFFQYLERICTFCNQLPLSIGGGIRGMGDVEKMFNIGADRIIINSLLFNDPPKIKEIAKEIGSQSVIVSIDFVRTDSGVKVFKNQSGEIVEGKPFELCQLAQDLGAGEVILTSVDNDGMLNGYEMDFIGDIAEKLSIPIIANGGASGYEDFSSFLDRHSSISGLAASSIFLYTEITPRMVSRYLSEKGYYSRIVDFDLLESEKRIRF